MRANMKLNFPKYASCGYQVCITDRPALQSPSCQALLPANAHNHHEAGVYRMKSPDPQPLAYKDVINDSIKNWGR